MKQYTTDGVEIKPGMRVFTNDCRWGTVSGVAWTELTGTVWWNVDEDNHGRCPIDGSRMSTRDNIAYSRDELAEKQRREREDRQQDQQTAAFD
jgi:hypothetical protein